MKKLLGLGMLIAVGCLAWPAWVSADANTPNTSSDKTGANPNPQYGSAAANAPQSTAGEPKTVSSGKRHRTHRKHGAQSADANKTINSADVTPSK